MMKILSLSFLLFLALVVSACDSRIGPLSPRRANTDVHQLAQSNQDCIECHKIAKLSKGHQTTDDCLRCHHIVQGD